jgi:2-amino-4-hydroxy-6-hydroxymethyldihydropteridine diphosphokinase
MNKAYLLIGSNMGNRVQNIGLAKDLIQLSVGAIASASSVYETAAWGKQDQPDFLNQVIIVKTKLKAEACMKKILLIENAMGRIRRKKNDPRIIDIDILFFNNEIINEDALTIPHPELHNRKFVLIPMNELSPDLIHPVLNQSIQYLLSNSKDELEVKVFSK